MKWRKASETPKKEDWYYIKFGGTKRCAMFRDGDWEVPYPTDNENFLWLDETEEGQQIVISGGLRPMGEVGGKGLQRHLISESNPIFDYEDMVEFGNWLALSYTGVCGIDGVAYYKNSKGNYTTDQLVKKFLIEMNQIKSEEGQRVFTLKDIIALADYINDNGVKWHKSDSWGTGESNTERIVKMFITKIKDNDK